MLSYQWRGETIVHERAIANQFLQLRAHNVRREHTGVHATVEVVLNGITTAWDEMNVGRNDNRRSLVRASAAPLERVLGKDVGKQRTEELYLLVDQFCYSLWDIFQQRPIVVDAGTDQPASPMRFLLRPYVLWNAGTIIFGPPGRGKSYTLLLMQICVDSGCSPFWTVEPTNTLLINLERSADSVNRRIANINTALGLPRGRRIKAIHARGKSLVDVAEQARRYVAEHDVGCVFVDSITRAGAGDLNNNRDANTVVDILNGMGPAWVGLGHSPRGDESHVYGSQMFDAGADIMVRLSGAQEAERPLGVGLSVVKNNDTGRSAQQVLAYEFGEEGLATIRPARRGEFPDVEGAEPGSMRDQVLQYLGDEGPTSPTDLARELGFDRSAVAQELRRHPNLYARGDKIGREQRYLRLVPNGHDA